MLNGAQVSGSRMPSIRHVGETAVTLVAVLLSPCSDGRLEPVHQLSPRPSAVVHLDALRPSRAGRLRAGRQPRSAPACHTAPGMPGSHADLGPGAAQPEADGAFAPDCRQGHRSSQRVPAEPYLPVTLTCLALVHRPSQFKPHKRPEPQRDRSQRAARPKGSPDVSGQRAPGGGRCAGTREAGRRRG